MLLTPPLPPMEAELVDEIPQGVHWQYEPKWDGFRCIAFRDHEHIRLQSKGLRPLERYFPDVVQSLRGLMAERFVLDGEIVIPVDGDLDFEELQLRLHPAASRVEKLVRAHRAVYIVFDLLADDDGRSLTAQPLSARRNRLERFAQKYIAGREGVELSPATQDLGTARRWFEATGGGLDGLIAKRVDVPYQSGERSGMVKIKNIRTADCVVGGFRYANQGRVVGSLLLGLFDENGRLDHVGFTSNLNAVQRRQLTPQLLALQDKPGDRGFTGRAPGGPSRWAPDRSGEFEALPHELVVEVAYDHFSGGRFRHGTRLVRWRPDKLPTQCTMDQVQRVAGKGLELLRRRAA